MPTTTLYTLEASNITISGGGSLSGITQGDGSHLAGQTITLGTNSWATLEVDDSDANFQDNDSGQTLDGAQTYDGVSYADGARVEAEYTLTLQDPDGNTYTVIGLNIVEGGGPSYATAEGLAFVGPVGGFPPIGVPLTVIGTSEGPTGTTTPYSSYATPPCFTAGTMIETARGPVPIEDLCVGDLVHTLDGGLQPVRWIGNTRLTAIDLLSQSRLRPVVIPKGALGPGVPCRDLVVSPMHRVLQSSARAQLLFESHEVLVPAIHMVGTAGIYQRSDLSPVTYIHVAFDDHQIIRSDDTWTESYLPGAQAISGLDQAVRTEIKQIFGDGAPTAARPCLRRYEVDVLFAA